MPQARGLRQVPYRPPERKRFQNRETKTLSTRTLSRSRPPRPIPYGRTSVRPLASTIKFTEDRPLYNLREGLTGQLFSASACDYLGKGIYSNLAPEAFRGKYSKASL